MQNRVPFWLALAGTLPFLYFSIGLTFQWFEDAPAALSLLLIYAAVFFSYLGGVHWGLAIGYHRHNPRIANYLLGESLAASLLAWGIMIIPALYLRLLAFAFLYAMIWGIDSILFNHKIIPRWFFTLRGIVTPIVVVSMYVSYFSIVS